MLEKYEALGRSQLDVIKKKHPKHHKIIGYLLASFLWTMVAVGILLIWWGLFH